MSLPKLRTVAFFVAAMRDNYFLTSAQSHLRSHFAKTAPRHQRVDAPVVLIQDVEDDFYFALFGKIVAGLRAAGPLRVDGYSLRALRLASASSLRQFFWNMVSQNWLSDWKWRRLYGAFADRIAYSTAGWLPPWTALRLWRDAWSVWRSLKSVDALVQLSIDGISVGDLIIDSYLRFKPAPALDLTDPYLLVIIRQTMKNIGKAARYCDRNKPALYLTSYTTYIQHGVPARVAAQRGIPIRAFSNLQEPTTAITRDNLWHTRDSRNYRNDFSALPDQAERIAAAEAQLNDRVAGKIDPATGYMKTSAYGSTAMVECDVLGKPVIFLHDFYDSVHIYRWICFHDFWTWACFTIDTLQAAGIAFAVKPHPNQVTGSSAVIEQLLKKYPDLTMIPTNVTNDQLVRGGMACAVTVYGTVASEMAFMGVPSISCGENPHISFDFCHTARTPVEYAELLRNYDNLPGTPADRRQESCIFYYMHNMHIDSHQRLLKDKMAELRHQLLFVAARPQSQQIIEAADAFASGQVFQNFCSSLYDVMREQASRHQVSCE
jgi:hypothetical protein